jgi:hypothetical protein
MPAEPRAKIHPYTLKWAEGGAKLSGVEAIRGFNQTMELRRLAALLFGKIDYLISPTAPRPAFAAERCLAGNDPERPFEHIALRCRGISPSSRRVDQRRVHDIRPADRRADHRPPLRRPRRAQAGESLGNRARPVSPIAEVRASPLLDLAGSVAWRATLSRRVHVGAQVG